MSVIWEAFIARLSICFPIICRIKLHGNAASVQIDFKLLNYLAHISHLFFPVDSLITRDSTNKIFLYASEFIWLPISITSVQSTEPGPEAAVHDAVMKLCLSCFTGEMCSLVSLSSVLAADAIKACRSVVYHCPSPVLMLFHQ